MCGERDRRFFTVNNSNVAVNGTNRVNIKRYSLRLNNDVEDAAKPPDIKDRGGNPFSRTHHL